MTQLCSILHCNHMLTGIKNWISSGHIDVFKFKCYMKINLDEDC